MKDSGLNELEKEKFDISNEDVLLGQLQTYIEKYKKKLLKKDINWETISEILMTRSSVDCRHKWGPFIYGKITNTETFSEKEDRRLIRGVRKQQPNSKTDIDFSLIRNDKIPSQNRYRWNILYRAISGRLNLPISEVLEKLENAYLKTNETEGPETIVDFYKQNYLD